MRFIYRSAFVRQRVLGTLDIACMAVVQKGALPAPLSARISESLSRLDRKASRCAGPNDPNYRRDLPLTKSMSLPPDFEQTSRSRQPGTGVSAPYRPAISEDQARPDRRNLRTTRRAEHRLSPCCRASSAGQGRFHRRAEQVRRTGCRSVPSRRPSPRGRRAGAEPRYSAALDRRPMHWTSQRRPFPLPSECSSLGS